LLRKPRDMQIALATYQLLILDRLEGLHLRAFKELGERKTIIRKL
jgi:hypothetical protein